MMDFTRSYQRETWLGFLENSFLPEDFSREEKRVSVSEKYNYAKEVTRLGECGSLELTVFEIKHSSANDPRVGLSKDAFKIICNYTQFNRAIILFAPQNNDSRYRFSLATMDIILKEEQSGKTKRMFSNPRRFSYMLGANCKRHTPEVMLEKKGRVKDFADLRSRFAIETVTKEFYHELFKWYDDWAISLVKFPAGVGARAGLPAKPDAEANRLPLIRLITRLIFVWFLKQKDNLIPEWIFNKNEIAEVLKTFDPHSDTKGNYYNGIIQNLFFATLNKEIKDRAFTSDANSKEHYGIKTFYRDHADAKHPADTLFKISQQEFIKKFETVPFLNGGLFECLDRRDGSEKQKYVDGFSREKSRAAFVPNCLFFGDGAPNGGHEGVIDLFSRYNFTVEENTPQDIDIALDPELLGKVFENLLGTYNEETKSTARNESGSFYTPREIVDYMVDTSLKEYFKEKLCGKEIVNSKEEIEKKLDVLFSYNEAGHGFNAEETDALMNAINRCKILDPACGSGAFPMGVLNKLTFIMEKLDPDNKLWEEIQIQKAKEETEEAYRSGLSGQAGKERRDERIKEISDVFELSTGAYSNYARKLFLIENCIFGIDIQPIAIQISKLRFFISLIVDQKTGGDKTNNYNVLPLPNLETKFVAANTLIGVKREQGVLADPAIEEKQRELLAVRHKHFSARKAAEKTFLRKQDVALSKELAALLGKDGFCNSADAQKMADWNPYDQTQAVDFFDAYWMFGITDGFDVVIGNPPYIQLQSNHGELADMYKNSGYESFSRSGDMYQLFCECGYTCLRENGHLCLITSNKWMRAAYGEKTRTFFANNTNTKILIDFAGQRVFESATVDVNIILMQKNNNKQETLSCIIKEDCKDNMTEYIRQHGTTIEFSAGDSWVILNPIEKRIKEKIEKIGKPLKEWDISINYGIKTGCNEAFIIDRAKRDELIAKDEKSAEIIRPILRGRDIERYKTNFAELYIINTHNGIPAKNIPPVDIKEYPAVKKHLDTYWQKIKNRDDQGVTPYNLRSCAYMDDFSKQKIAWNRIASEKQFALVEQDIFISDSMHFITGNKLEFLCCVLNSKLFKWLLYLIIGEAAGGNAGNADNITNLHIPKPTTQTEQQLKKLLKEKNYQEIDKVIYELYGLNMEEIDFISSAVKP
ncbi:MAG: hypothetical protein Pg6A_00210 [Termitinemataceae bacterium]|nr:MAG: hypothetical protein Pg6A_00210 [Termitinemataceae bacterium]